VAGIQGYRVVTAEGKRVGRVAGESASALVVRCGLWPRRWRALPWQYAAIDEEDGCVLMQVSKELLAKSPKVKPGTPIDDRTVASWWGLD
jgi:hypothetical protein